MNHGRALLLEGVHADADPILEAVGLEVIRETGALSEEALDSALDGVTVLGVRSKSRLSCGLLERHPDLLAVGCFCIGTDQLDLRDAARRGLAVFNADVLDDDVSMFASDSVRETFKLKFTGRWQHRVKYVKAQAKGKGLLLDAHAGVEKLRAESLLGWHAKSKEVVRLDAVSFVDTAVFAFRKSA